MTRTSPQPIALVTGASRGIGRAVALELAARELAVWVGFRDRRADAEATCALIAARGGRAEPLRLDVADPGSFGELAARLRGDACLAAVVHAAGIVHRGLVVQTSPDAWDRVVRTNLGGFHNVCRAVLRPMIRHGGGSIVAIGSSVARGGLAGHAAYAASKAGLVAAARSLAREVGPLNVRVNVVEPGWIETDMNAGISPQDVLPRIPLRRTGRPDEVAAVAGFLCSPAASYVTGAAIPVTGGLEM